MLAFLIWITVLVISTILFYRVSGSLSLLKPNQNTIIFFYSLVVSSYIGSLLIVLDIDNYYMINKLNHDIYRYIGFAVISYVMLAMPLTMLVVSKVFGFDAKKEFNGYLDKPVEIPKIGKRNFYILFLSLSIVCMLSVAYTLLKTVDLPILELVKGNFAELGKLRIDAARGFSGNVYIRNIFAIALTPLLSLIAYVYAVKTMELKWIFLHWALFVSAILICTYDLAKSPIFFYFIMFIIVRIYIGKMKMNWKKILLIGAVGSGVVILMYVFIQGVDELTSYLSYSSGPIGRIILAQVAPTFLHLNIFGEALPLLDGRSLPSIIISWFDMDQVRSARLVMANAFPGRVADGTGGVLNTLFVAEAFANFGYLGVIIGTIYVGVFVQCAYILFIRLPKNPVLLCLFIYFSVNIPRTIVGGFADFLFNPVWIFITVVLGGLLLFIRFQEDLFSFLQKKKAGTLNEE